MKIADDQWNADYAAGRWQFLGSPKEQMRLACIASFIATYAPGELIDLGCGPGHLLQWLHPGSVTRYVGVDVSDVALAKIPEAGFPVERVAASIADFDATGRPAAAVVASEVLYFVEDPARQVQRIVSQCDDVRGVAVCLVAPNPNRPNWERASARIWSAFDALGWPRVQSAQIRDEASQTGWDLAFYAFDRA